MAFTAQLKPLKGASYVGAAVAPEVVAPWLEALREALGDEVFEAYTQARRERNGGEVFHVTAFTPRETRALRKADRLPEILPSCTFTEVGVGTVEDGEAQAYYLVVKSPEVQALRGRVGLGEHHLHVTLAFRGRDVHQVAKEEATVFIEEG